MSKSRQAINGNISSKTSNSNNHKHNKSLDRQNTPQADTNQSKDNSIRMNSKEIRKSKESGNSSNSHSVTSTSKPGTEVLTLIATWIKNAPNDFMDTRVIDEIKHFFNQLDSLKSSFKPWTAKLKHALNLEVHYKLKKQLLTGQVNYLF